MAGKSPTKSARRRANERLRKQSAVDFAKQFGPLPDYLLAAAATLGSNTDIYIPSDSWERAPAHVVVYDECPDLNRVNLRLIAQSAAEERSLKRGERISQLRLLCGDVWGMRGKAHVVQERWNKAGEGPISIRTIQQYFRESRI